MPKDIPWAEEPDLNVAITKLSSIFYKVGDKFTYTYDFGDDLDFNNPDIECGEIGEIEGL